MAKLTRWTMPVFAGSAAQDETSVFGTMKTSPEYTSDVAAAIDTQAYNNGWTDAVEIGYAPFLEDMNSLQRAITYQISYNQQQGIPEWKSDTEYYIGSLAKLNTANGSQVYSSLIDNNVGNLVSDTTKWKLLFDSENSYVTTNTAQTITGAKTFTDETTIKRDILFNNNDATKGTNPQNTVYWGLVNGDSSGAGRLGLFETKLQANGQVETYIAAYKNESGSSDSALMSVVYPASGNPYATAPTPATSANDDEIATAAFVKNQGYLTSHQSLANYVTLNSTQTISGQKTFSATAYGKASDAANSLLTTVASLFETSGTNKRYLKLGNGWIVQVGEFTYDSGNGEVEVTLPYTMSTTKYYVGVTFLTTARNSPGCITGRYTNKFKYKSSTFQNSGTALYIVVGK